MRLIRLIHLHNHYKTLRAIYPFGRFDAAETGDLRSRLVEARPNGPAVKEHGPLCEIEDCRLADPPRIPDAERRYPGGFVSPDSRLWS